MEEGSIRWGCWYGDRDRRLLFPEGWRVRFFPPQGGPDIGEDGIAQAFARPIGTGLLRDLARGCRTAVIVVDDLTRPTPAFRLLPFVVRELLAGGLSQDRIRILLGVAAHHPMNRHQIIRKLGRAAIKDFWIQNHNPYENLENLGTTSLGTPVWINRQFLRADIKIAIGSLLPHGHSGFGGGSKLVLPGVAGIATIEQNHRGDNGLRRGLNLLDGNQARQDMEEAARMAGLTAIVNVVLNPLREIVGCFVGDPIEAHRAAAESARQVYRTSFPKEWDVVIASAYPKDSEFYQWVNALVPLKSTAEPIVHEQGTIVVASAGSEGVGVHYLAGPGGPLGYLGNGPRYADDHPGPEVLLYCPSVNHWDVEQWGWDGRRLYNNWNELVRHLKQKHGKAARVAIFPCACQQLLTGDLVA
ncbi:MAG: lactate racemase domain-containing protein [Armatimonadetes bacterium]|nr:lactate racemase domain-containing protein [Armatimonadota bacterium]MDW8122917.1 lactate racemase domain-containing protein [Armatimonadota bacterium]